MTELLQRWANFYASMSQAAATLIGLLFVVITVAVENRPDATAKIRGYLTTTVVYFASVFGVAELLTIPDHSRLTAALCIGFVSVAGLIYSGSFVIGRGAKESYFQKGDAMIYAVFPFATYALLGLGAVLILFGIQHSLNVVAACLLLLLTLGIRNSWSVVVTVVSTRKK